MDIAIGIFGLIIGFITLYYSFFRKPKEELEHLKTQFKSTQNLSKKLQIELACFIESNSCGDEIMFNGVTYTQYLTQLKLGFEEYLSDNLYSKLENHSLSKQIINSMIKSLENQFSDLQEIQMKLKIMNRATSQK
jgi:hypothetical protein